MNQWLSQHPILFLSDDTVSLIHRFCRGEGLYTIQDMLSRVFINSIMLSSVLLLKYLRNHQPLKLHVLSFICFYNSFIS